MDQLEVKKLLECVIELTGQPIPFPEAKYSGKIMRLSASMGLSQFNELLLTLGYDRVSPAFFGYLTGRRNVLSIGKEFEDAIDVFQTHAMLLFGNIKYAFKRLSTERAPELRQDLLCVQPVPLERYQKRHAPFQRLEKLDPEDTYLLGYVIEEQLKECPNPALQGKMERARKIGRANHAAYLTSDHMAVYIATSMRQRHEFYLVSNFVTQLFRHPLVEQLNLRWFDPTQAYVSDRIDKGLVEGLMLKRASCTIYHVQETDTLGKDSELAATLAQGKAVTNPSTIYLTFPAADGI